MNDNTKTLCYSYFAGEISRKAATQIRAFLAESEANRALFREWEAEWKTGHIPTLYQIDSFKKLRARIIRRRNLRTASWAIGAAAAIALLFLLLPGKGTEAPNVIPVVPNVFTVETRYCEQTKVILPDSTLVWLNAASRLSYTDEYMTDRRVKLSGEGYFDVRHNPSAPFTVEMGENRITVSGTKFNACAYPGEGEVEAALLEGCIAFCNASVQVDMQPGEILSYRLSDDNLKKYSGDVRSRTSWLRGTLECTSISLDRLLARISSIYGVDIRYSGENTQEFGFILNLKESLPNILDALSCIRPITWKQEDGIYYVQTR